MTEHNHIWLPARENKGVDVSAFSIVCCFRIFASAHDLPLDDLYVINILQAFGPRLVRYSIFQLPSSINPYNH